MSSGNVYIPAISLAVAANNAGVSIPIGPDRLSNMSYTIYHGAIVGTFAFYVSNDPRASASHADHANADWYNATSEYTSIVQPAGVAGSLYVPFTDIGVAFVKLAYTHTSGTGVLRAHFNGNSN